MPPRSSGHSQFFGVSCRSASHASAVPGMSAVVQEPCLVALGGVAIVLNWLLLLPLAMLTMLDMAFRMRARTATNLPAGRE